MVKVACPVSLEHSFGHAHRVQRVFAMRENPDFIEEESSTSRAGEEHMLEATQSSESRDDADLYESVGGPEKTSGGVSESVEVPSEEMVMPEVGVDQDRTGFGGLDVSGGVLEQIIGRDDRKEVEDTTQMPWSTVCHLRFPINGTTYVGTGCLIGKQLVLTCGHNVFDNKIRRWADWVEITPGRQGRSAPFGSVTVKGGANGKLRTLKAYRDGNDTFDFAAILLPANAFNRDPGTMPVGKFKRNELVGAPLHLSGYPGTPPRRQPHGGQWKHSHRCKRADDLTLVYDIDTTEGNSGGPVWVRSAKDGIRLIVGVHVAASGMSNIATRINDQLFALVQKWRKESES